MDKIKIYKYSLLLPIIIPIIFAPSLLFLRSLGETLAIIVLSIVYSGLVGGIPYLILAIILFKRMQNNNEGQIRKDLLLSPIFMILIFSGCYALAQLLFNLTSSFREKLSQFTVGVIFASIFILIFGYVYVGLVFSFVKLRSKS